MTTATVDSLIKQYKDAQARFHKQNAPAVELVLDIAKTVYGAKQTLNRTQFSLFVSKTDLRKSDKGKTLRHLELWLAIGRNAEKLEQFAAHLPSSITSLSKLAVVPTPVLRQAIVDGDVRPLATTIDIVHVLNEYRARVRANQPETPKAQPGPGRPPKVRLGDPAPITAHRQTQDVAGDLSLTLRFVGKDFDPRKAAAFVQHLRALVTKHADRFGLVPNVLLSFPLECTLAEASRDEEDAVLATRVA